MWNFKLKNLWLIKRKGKFANFLKRHKKNAFFKNDVSKMSQCDKKSVQNSMSILSMHIQFHEIFRYLDFKPGAFFWSYTSTMKMKENTAAFYNSEAIEIFIVNSIVNELQVL